MIIYGTNQNNHYLLRELYVKLCGVHALTSSQHQSYEIGILTPVYVWGNWRSNLSNLGDLQKVI